MTGQINVNKIVARSGNSITYDSADVVNITLAKGEGTASTNLKQGLVKHWATINNGDTVADSFNQSSITDNSGSDCTYNFATAMGNANYSNSFMATYDNSTNPFRTLGYFGSAPTTAAFRTHAFYDTTMPTNDMTISTVGTFGDLS